VDLMLTIPDILKLIPSRYKSKEGKPVNRSTLWRWIGAGWFPKPDRHIADSPVWEPKSVRAGIRSAKERGLLF
jgi:hypothetical protein